jgi:hypothetical protein
MGAADSDLYGRIQGFGQQPNYAAMQYSNAMPAFNQVYSPSGYNPSDSNMRGDYLAKQGQGMGQYADMALQSGFDPQDAIYGRARHNLEQQTRSALEARGVNSTPYGAAVEGETMSNFNMDWADRALGRQQTGANTAATLYGQGARQISGGDDMQRTVPTWQAAMLAALQQSGGANYQYPESVIRQYQGYMNTGLQGDQNAVGAYRGELAAWEAEQQQQAAMWQALGSLGGSAVSMAMNPASAFGMQLWG